MQEHLYRTFRDVESHHWWMVARREILRSVLSTWIRPGGKVLDVGCGTGAFLEEAQGGFDVWGVDLSPHAVAFCKGRGLANVFEGSATDLRQVDQHRFDAVLLLDVIEHVDDDVAALREARRVLAPGGRLVITVPAFMYLWSEHDVINEHKRRYTAPELERAIVTAGFSLDKLSYYNSYLFPIAVAVRTWQRLRRITPDEYAYKPGLVNSALRRIFAAEKGWLERRDFPVGVSLLAVTKPHSATTPT